MLVSQNKEMAAMLVSQTKPLGIEPVVTWMKTLYKHRPEFVPNGLKVTYKSQENQIKREKPTYECTINDPGNQRFFSRVARNLNKFANRRERPTTGTENRSRKASGTQGDYRSVNPFSWSYAMCIDWLVIVIFLMSSHVDDLLLLRWLWLFQVLQATVGSRQQSMEHIQLWWRVFPPIEILTFSYEYEKGCAHVNQCHFSGKINLVPRVLRLFGFCSLHSPWGRRLGGSPSHLPLRRVGWC